MRDVFLSVHALQIANSAIALRKVNSVCFVFNSEEIETNQNIRFNFLTTFYHLNFQARRLS